MKKSIVAGSLTLFVIFMLSTMSGCSGTKRTGDPKVDAIIEIRKILDLPERPLTYIEDTFMANSPNGNLKVSYYVDDEDRKYYVDVETNQVVEIDARSILDSIPEDEAAIENEKLKSEVDKMVAKIIPDFESVAEGLTFSSGDKGDNRFFDWRAEMIPGDSMPRFLQIGIHESGVVFSYYNTLEIDQ